MEPDKKEIEKYYDEIALQKLSAFIKPNPRVESAWQSLVESVSAPKHILEIGCGIGDITYRAGQTFKEANVVGLDISSKSIELANKIFSGPTTSFVAGELNAIENGGFDLIVLMDVFEHISKTDRPDFLKKLATLITPNAFIFGSCPTPEFLAWLRINSPKNIQPVDEDITLSVINEMATVCNRRIWYYKTVSIWFSGDYFHFLLGPDHVITPNPVPKVVAEKPKENKFSKLFKSTPEQPVKMEDKNRDLKINLVREKMGSAFTEELLKLIK